MNSTLDVNIMLNADCGMVAVDNSDYEHTLTGDIKTHAIVEFLQNNEDITINQRLHIIRGQFDPQINTSLPIPLPKDGAFTYYRMVIPTFEHFKNEETHKYDVAGMYFAKVVYNRDTKTHSEEIFYSEDDLDSFDLTKVRLIEDYQEVWDAIDSGNQIYWFNSKFFSICKLNNCLVSRIKKSIDKTVKDGCNFECNKKDEKQLQIDFLLESSFALKYLIEQNRLEDAQRVLNTLNSCGGLCSEDSETNSSNCNCGKAL